MVNRYLNDGLISDQQYNDVIERFKFKLNLSEEEYQDRLGHR